MKILKIEFQNINSLEGKHCINFQDERFTHSSLFAITGTTGSGKSSILDVISLGIYNQTPRFHKITNTEIQKNGAIITRGKTESYAQVTYLCEKGIFTSEWRIRIKRTGTIDFVQMNIYNEKGISICQKTKEVPDINTQNIGLNYEQFIKSVLLAQGDFALFLKVNKKERSDLLEKITGTDIYRKLGQLAFERNKNVKNTIKQWEDYKNTLLTQVIPKNEIQEKERVLTSQKIELQSVEQKLGFLEKQKELQEKYTDLNQKITKNKEFIGVENQKKIVFHQEKGKKLALHNKTEHIANELLQWKGISENLSESQEKYQAELLKETSLLKEKNRILNEVSQFIQKQCDEHSFLNTIKAFQKEIIDLEKKRTEKQSEYREEKVRLDNHLKILNLDNKKNVLELKKIVKNIENRLNEEISCFNNEFKIKEDFQIENEINTLNAEIKKLQQAEKKAFEIGLKTQNFEILFKEQQSLKNTVSSLPEQIKKLKNNILITEKEVDILLVKKENADLRLTLSDYRKKLVEGEPCPLCGAIHHPFENQIPYQESELEIEIKQQQNRLKEYQKDLLKAENQLSESNNRLLEIQNIIENKHTELEQEKESFFVNFHKFSLTENWSLLQEIKENKISQLKKYQENTVKILECNAIFPIVEKLQNITIKGKEITELLQQKIGDKNITEWADLQKNEWADLQKIFFNNQQKKKELLENKEQKKQEKQRLEEFLLPLICIDFQSVEEALKVRLPFSEAWEYTQEIQNIEKKLQALIVEKEVFENELKEIEPLVDFQKIIDFSLEIENFTKKKIQIESEIKNLEFILRNNREKEKEIREMNEKITLKNQENGIWGMLDKLIGDSQGAKFNQFAQDLTLQQLLHLANKQLKKLSTRYLLSQPYENEDDSLVAIDKEMGFQRRSVKTLSGGESFILSLALALALSELASNNVKINSLFIDEGFGTLDPETLDQTLDTLELLQQENDKMIGIISHIDSLKERISTQIRIKQKGSGFSVLEIFPKK